MANANLATRQSTLPKCKPGTRQPLLVAVVQLSGMPFLSAIVATNCKEQTLGSVSKEDGERNTRNEDEIRIERADC